MNDAERDALLQRLLDKEEIRDALARYSRGIDRVDVETALSAYHDDAYDDHGPFKGLARDFVARPRTNPANRSAHHFLGQTIIDLDGAQAYAETYFIYQGVLGAADANDRLLLMVGRYLDRFEKRADRWAIAYRRVVMDFTEERELSAPRAGAENYAPALRWPDDVVYHLESLVFDDTRRVS